MLKIIESTGFAAKLKETKGKTGGNNIVDNNVVGGGEITNPKSFTKEKNRAKTTKSKILVKNKNLDFLLYSRNMEARLGFLIPKARLAFIQLRQAFVEAPIFHHFDQKWQMQMKTDASKYVIGEILNQLTLDDLS